MYIIFNLSLHLIHFLVILFSVVGFFLKEALYYHLSLQFLISISWIGYGLYDGRWGRCVVTDVQWYCKEKFRTRPSTESFVDYWLIHKLKFNLNPAVTEKAIVLVFVVTTLLSVIRVLGSF